MQVLCMYSKKKIYSLSVQIWAKFKDSDIVSDWDSPVDDAGTVTTRVTVGCILPSSIWQSVEKQYVINIV